METFRSKFTSFYINILRFLILLLVIASSYMIIRNKIGSHLITTIYLLAIILEIFIIINKNINKSIKIISILAIGFTLRLLWLLNIKSVPVSDFNTIYETAQKLLQGDTTAFYGTNYIARFPHLTFMVLYMSLIIKLFPYSNLLVMKGISLLLGVFTIYIIYKIVEEIFDSKKLGLYGGAIASIFPPLVVYVGVYCTENLAIPLYLLSIYFFVRVMKNKSNKYYLILSGITLSFGNLFRMVATIMLIAYAMYIVIYKNDKIFNKIREIFLYLVPYYLVLIIISGSLQLSKITEFPLWSGSEPKITNVLKGTNIESYGRWNSEDAAIVDRNNYDYDKIKEESKEIIIERLTTTPPLKLVKFYFTKYLVQWSIGDFEGVFWSKLNVEDKDIVLNINGNSFQLYYVIIIILIFLGLLNRKEYKEYQEINLIYIIICGYGFMNLITESQGRYSLIAAWTLVIAAVEGVRYIYKKLNKENYLEAV